MVNDNVNSYFNRFNLDPEVWKAIKLDPLTATFLELQDAELRIGSFLGAVQEARQRSLDSPASPVILDEAERQLGVSQALLDAVKIALNEATEPRFAALEARFTQ